MCSNLQALRALSQSRLRRYVGSILFPLANTIPVSAANDVAKTTSCNTTTFECFARDKDVNYNDNRVPKYRQYPGKCHWRIFDNCKSILSASHCVSLQVKGYIYLVFSRSCLYQKIKIYCRERARHMYGTD